MRRKTSLGARTPKFTYLGFTLIIGSQSILKNVQKSRGRPNLVLHLLINTLISGP